MRKTRESIITPLGLPVPVNRGNPPDESRRLGWPLGSVLPSHSRQDKMNSKLTIRTFEQSEIASVEISNRRLLNA
jgi:hypothetical protein